MALAYPVELTSTLSGLTYSPITPVPQTDMNVTAVKQDNNTTTLNVLVASPFNSTLNKGVWVR